MSTGVPERPQTPYLSNAGAPTPGSGHGLSEHGLSEHGLSEGVKNRVRATWGVGCLLLALPGLIGIPLFVGLIIWANIVYRGQ